MNTGVYRKILGRTGVGQDAERLANIRSWFERHRQDYCRHDDAPPQVWAEYFEYVLLLAEQAASCPRGEPGT